MTITFSGGSSGSKPGFIARTLFSVWLGFMIATTGMLALYPRLGQVSAPILCHGPVQVDTQHYRPSPGTQVTTRDFYCADGTRIGLGQLLPTTWIVYSVAIFILVELIALLGRRVPAAGGAAAQIGLFLLTSSAALVFALSYTEPVAAHADGAAAMPHACEVLTDGIAKRAIGDSAHLTRKAQPNPRETQCLYVGSAGSINLMVGDWQTIHRGSSFFGEEEAVAGIGEEAYLSKMHNLVVRKGGRGMEIGMTGAAGVYRGQAADDQIANAIAAQKKLALDLLTRL